VEEMVKVKERGMVPEGVGEKSMVKKKENQ